MRVAVLSLLLGVSACIPRLYSHGNGTDTDVTDTIDTDPCVWEGPANPTWPGTGPEGCLESTGWDVGDVPPDVQLRDQFGDQVSLWQFAGLVVLLDVSTMWCGPCQDLGLNTEKNWQDFKDDGFVYLTVLQQDFEANPTAPADVDLWVDTFEITAPVVADPQQKTLGAVPLVGGSPAFPGVLVIGRDLTVVDEVGTTDAEVRAAIEAAL